MDRTKALEALRATGYALAAAVLILLVRYGVIEAADVPLWIGFLGALFAFVMAVVAFFNVPIVKETVLKALKRG